LHRAVKFFLEESEIFAHFHYSKKAIPGYDFCLPTEEAFSVANDKHLTSLFAERMGIPVIPELLLQSAHLDKKMLFRFFKESEIVTKPRSLNGSRGIRFFEGVEDLGSKLEVIEDDLRLYGSLLVQKRITGKLESIGVSLLFDSQGRCINAFVHKRLHQFPISGGPSTRSVSIKDSKLLAESKRLLEGLNWQGIAMVEWLRESSSGRVFLMEINPRPWGSVSLAIKSGQNFPVRYMQASLGEIMAPNLDYSEGIINRWLWPGDILRWLSERKFGLASTLTFLDDILVESEEWDIQDPKPFFVSALQSFSFIFRPSRWRILLDKHLSRHKHTK
jgi:hypothetical protein